MKIDPLPQQASPVTLQTVLERLVANPSLTPSRKRDLRSAVSCFAKLVDHPPAAIALDLAAIRNKLDSIEPAWAKISRKRWANRRSDLAAAIDASGLRPMLKTAEIELDGAWKGLLADAEPRIARGLSRFARWASLRNVAPQDVETETMAHFVAELGDATLVRKLRYVGNDVSKLWNELVASKPRVGLRSIEWKYRGRVLKRTPWASFPGSFRADAERYIHWASKPDPLDDDARARALGLGSLGLQRQHIHSAASAAVAAGIPVGQLTTLSALVQPDPFRTVLRQLWRRDGQKLSAYTHGIAITLIAIAKGWVKAPPETMAALKRVRTKLGALPRGLTEKNEAMLAAFDDPRLLATLVHLPDRLWRQARRSKPSQAFILFQTALAIDILIHAPVRMQNLSAISFHTHLQWPQGPHKPALVRFGAQETKNDDALKFELPTTLSDRLQTFRNEIALPVIGCKPDKLFITGQGKPRGQANISLGIQKTIRRHLGVKMTPHQFRHLCAKMILDWNPGAYELVKQMLGHSSVKTTGDFYAGINTLRAGRAHASLVNELRETNWGRRRRRTKDTGEE